VKIRNYTIRIATRGFGDIHDITEEGRRNLDASGIRNGQATFFAVGATAGLTTAEYEPGLVADLQALFEKLVPQDARYEHERTWHDGNGFSHVRASLLKPSLTIPVVEGALTLGTWQQVILIDFDNRPRNREIVFQVIGD